MRDGWRLVQLGEVAHLDVEKVLVVSGTTYQIAGVLNAGKGMLRRDSIDGSDTNYPVLHRLRAGQLVMRKLTAWEGPITIVPEEYDGYVVSTEFPTFSLDVEELWPEFMRLICQQPGFWERMRDASTGTVQRRKRVNPAQLLAIPVLLPPVHEQRHIADLMAAIEKLISTADECGAQGEEARTALLAEILTPSEEGDWSSTSIGEVTQFVKRGRAPLYADDGLVVMSQKCVRAGNWIDWTAARHTDQLARPVPEWALVQPGDTLVNSTGRGTLVVCR